MIFLLPIFLFLLPILEVKAIINDYRIDKIDAIVQDGFEGLFATASYKGVNQFYRKKASTIAQTLNITTLYESDNEFTIKITRGEKEPRFFMPHEFPFSHTKTSPDDLRDPEYAVHIKKEPFSFSVERTSTEETIFDTSAFDFVYSEFFLTFGTKLPSKYLYGLGERRKRNFLFSTGTYTIWCKDQFIALDDGKGDQQTYGAHPVYMMREKSGNWHMMLLRTTNALDFHFDSKAETLKYSIAGGELELKFFLGDKNPDTAIKLYHNYINKWTLMPFWSFGYHQSRWGYFYLQDLIDAERNLTVNKLPHDVIWSDIDYMVNFTDFTVDADRFNHADFRTFLKDIRWIPVVDPGVGLDNKTLAYTAGTEYNIWMKSAKNHSNYLIGGGWPGQVHFPDWIHPNTSKYWGEMLEVLHSYVPFSGIWIDMNENANFCFGEYPNTCFLLPNYLPVNGKLPFKITMNSINRMFKKLPKSVDNTPDSYEFAHFNSTALPYVPGKTPLEDRGVSINALHHDRVLSFDFHNLNGFYESYYTYKGQMKMNGKRPFVLTRANYVGTGQFAAHWSGDNLSEWEFLRLSIPELFDLQVFGIPMAGADICGFMGDATKELCARWMQLGAFYPFMRNHNRIGSIPQEPYLMGPTVLETSRAALNFRYSILKFYYSVFIRNNGTGTVFRPLFFDFLDDPKLFDLQTQFLIGSELMVTAAVYKGMTHVGVYFPAGLRWYDFFTGKVMIDVFEDAKNVTIPIPLNATLPVFIKGGSIVHTQDVSNIRRSDDLSNIFNFVVALTPVAGDSSVAFGQMMGIKNYTSDDSLDKCTGTEDCLINVAVNAVLSEFGDVDVTLSFDQNREGGILEDILIGNITFYGVKSDVCEIGDITCVSNDYNAHCKSEEVPIKLGSISYKLNKDACVRI